jgi:hypothetical protein
LYTPSSANREYAKGSTTSITTPSRIRKRGVDAINNDKLSVSLGNDRKRACTYTQLYKIDNFELIASLIREQQEERRQLCINNIQKALKLLDLEYKLRLLEDDFDSAIDVLGDSQKASSFISLIGNVRDRWIKRYAAVQLLVQEGDVFDI